MPSPDYYLKSGDASFLKVYEKYARDVAVLFGAASRERRQKYTRSWSWRSNWPT